MASSLIVAALVKNESSRYWKSCLQTWSEFADKIVVLDDNSTDKTAAMARKVKKAVVYTRYGASAWGAESEARRELFDTAMSEAEVGDHVLWLDADMVPLADPREFINNRSDTYFFTLYDLWGRDGKDRLVYREDAFWSAHTRPRAWMVRKSKHLPSEWGDRGLHCGHLPLNYESHTPFFVPPSHALLHYGYADEADRHEKAAAYLAKRDQLSVQEVAHARSIVDDAPFLKPLLVKPKWELIRKGVSLPGR